MSNRRTILLSGGLIAAAGLAAYWNSLTAPFVFDDIPSILDNPTIRQLWPLSGPLNPPRDFGYTVSGRPVLNLSLAVNYAISGTSPWSYHVVNLLIHIMAGLLLFGLSRRVLPRVAGGRGFASAPVEPKHPDRVVPPYHLKVFATPAACAIALLWTLHPLQTQAVTYVVQRAESLMGLFYLMTVYAFVRMAGAGGGWKWGAVSVFACLLGVGTKEVAVTAPVFVLMADRVFYCDSVLAALRRRPLYYLALAATWLPLAWLVLGTGGDRGGTFRWSAEAFLPYWLTQPEALTRYLGLTVWPHPLVFEYGIVGDPRRAVLIGCSLMIALLLGLTAWLWWRRRPESLGLGAFFLLLAPTSLMPGAQIIVEHRMYLPLAALIGVLVAATTAWVGRRGLALCFALAIAAGMATADRNRDYQDPVRLWTDTVQKRPTSAKAHNNLAHAYYHRGEFDAAIRHYEQAVKLEPGVAQVHFNLGLALQDAGRPAEAIKAYAEAVRLLPNFAQAQALLGVLLAKEGRVVEAHTHLQHALALRSNQPEVHLGFGLLLLQSERFADAAEAFARAAELAPALLEARLQLGVAFTRQGRLTDAVNTLRKVVAEAPATAEAHASLGIALAESREFEAAVASYGEAIRLRPDYANAHYNLGNALLELRRWREAREAFESALKFQPDFDAAREMLARMRAANLPD
jgi:tetratricopeptide (TPR) repeat protein